MNTEREYLDALDRAARSYRQALTHIVEECANDKPRIEHIREAAESGIRAADYELAEVEGWPIPEDVT